MHPDQSHTQLRNQCGWDKATCIAACAVAECQEALLESDNNNNNS